MSILVYKEILSEYLREEGLILPSRLDLIEKKLKKAMGKARYIDYLEICERVHSGDPQYTLCSLYDAVSTREEAHLLFSHQSDMMVECFTWMAENLHRSLDETRRVAEVGCATGLLSGALSRIEDFSGIAFTGFDREEHFIQLARESGDQNKYVVWDYASKDVTLGDYDIVMANLAIDFNRLVRRHHEIGATSLRGIEAYESFRGECARSLCNWRQLSRDGGTLLAILRLPSLLEFLAFVDSASHAGWRIDLDRLEWIKMDDEQIPAMVFKTGASVLREERELVSAWMAGSLRAGNGGIYTNDAASTLYRLLEPKEVMKEGKMEYSDGNVMVSEVSRCGPFALHFAEATTGFGRLEIHPIHKLQQLEPKFEWGWE
jgi:SAM-dependent methyltransferase